VKISCVPGWPSNLRLPSTAGFGSAQPSSRQAAERRHPDDRRHRLERFRCLFRRRRGSRPSDPEHRPRRAGRRSLHELVRPGERHGRTRFLYHGTYPDPLGALDRGGPGDENALRKETPTVAEFFKRKGYSTYFSGKWHLGDKPESYPIERGFDETKAFAACYPGVYTYSDTSKWFPSYNPEFSRTYFDVVNMFEYQNLHMLDESVQVHAMHIPIKQPDLLAPQANPLKVQEDHEAGERIVDDLS
jgi:hypothetical protein